MRASLTDGTSHLVFGTVRAGLYFATGLVAGLCEDILGLAVALGSSDVAVFRAGCKTNVTSLPRDVVVDMHELA